MSKTRSTTPLHRVLWGSLRQPTRTGDSALTVWGLCTHTNSRGHLFPSPSGHALPHHSEIALQYCESLFITLLLQLKLLLRHIPYFATSKESLLVFPVIQCCFNNSYPPFKAQFKCLNVKFFQIMFWIPLTTINVLPHPLILYLFF